VTTRFEWGHLEHPLYDVAYVPAGGFVGDDQTQDGALVLSFDDGMAIEGTPDQLRALALRILVLVPDENPRAAGEEEEN
jgi:hypothetical protein